MKRQLLLMIGCLLLLAGWMSAFLYRSIPQATDFVYIIPTILLSIGTGTVMKIVGGRLTAVVLGLTAVASVMTVNAFYPAQKISFENLQKNLSTASKGKDIPLQVLPKDRNGLFARTLNLKSHAEVEINLFARTPGPARMMAFDSAGQLYVSIPKLDAIYLLPDRDRDGYAEQPQLFYTARDADRPHGLVWQGERLFVAETSRLLELKDSDRDERVDEVRVILDGLPDDGGHWTRSLAMGKDNHLYLSIGSRCNACDEADERRATILKVDPASGASRIYARGLRNSVGLTFGADGALWASDNGRDMLGDNIPPDEINNIVAGGNYGWPYCFGSRVVDPELGSKQLCQDTLPSLFDLPAHSAPLGIVFGDDLAAPETYRNSLYVALHGSWNRSVPIGYSLVRIPFVDGKPVGSGMEFVTGWLRQGKAWGRPVAPVVGPDGALYLSDDRANAVYRIRWKDPVD